MPSPASASSTLRCDLSEPAPAPPPSSSFPLSFLFNRPSHTARRKVSTGTPNCAATSALIRPSSSSSCARISRSAVSTRPVRSAGLRPKKPSIPSARYSRSARSILLLAIPKAWHTSDGRQAPAIHQLRHRQPEAALIPGTVPVDRMHSQQINPVAAIVENPHLGVDWGCTLRDEWVKSSG